MIRPFLALICLLSSSSFALQLKAAYQSLGAIRAPSTIQFKVEADTALSDQTQYSWEFGDGTSSTLPSPQHIYYQPGTYRASITVQMPGYKPMKIDLNVKIEGDEEKAAFALLFAPDASVEIVNASRIYKPNAQPNWTINGKAVQGDHVLLRDDKGGKKTLTLNIEGSKAKYTLSTEFKLGTFRSNAAFEAKALQLTNDLREKGWNCDTKAYGGTPRPPLTASKVLARAAMAQSVGMAANLYFAHQSPRDNTLPIDRAIAAGYDARLVGENIARGYKPAEEVVDGWAHSHGHCVNIMGDFQELGISYIETDDKLNNFYWTQVFGSPF